MRQIFVFFVLIILSINCKRSNEKVSSFRLSDFKAIEKVDTGSVLTPEAVYTYPIQLKLTKDFMLVWEPNGLDYLMTVYDRKTLSYIGRTIKKGQAVNEVGNGGQCSTSEISDEIWLGDWAKYKLYMIDVNKIIKNKRTQFDSILPLPDISYDLCVVKNGILSSFQMREFTGYVFSLTKPEANEHEMVVPVSQLMDIENCTDNNVTRLSFDIDKRDETIIGAFRTYDLLFGTNLKGDIKFIRYGPEYEKYEFTDCAASEAICPRWSYRCLKIINNRFCVLYYAGPQYGVDKYGNSEVYGAKNLFVFDEQGNPIKRFEFTQFGVDDFVYDDIYNRLIVFSSELNNSVIIYEDIEI